MAGETKNSEFSVDEWNGAPQYWGPGTRELQEYGRSTVLDFERLTMLAEMQRDRGAFKPDNGTDVQKAPVKVGIFPGNFVSVESLSDDDFMFHHPFEVEVLVVMNGILEVERSYTQSVPRFSATPRAVLREGEVAVFRPGGRLKMTAHSLERRANSLSLLILGLADKIEHVITQRSYNTSKDFSPDYKPNLPYDPS